MGRGLGQYSAYMMTPPLQVDAQEGDQYIYDRWESSATEPFIAEYSEYLNPPPVLFAFRKGSLEGMPSADARAKRTLTSFSMMKLC